MVNICQKDSVISVFYCILLHCKLWFALADYVPVCKRSNPNFDKCVLESVEVVRPYLAKGKLVRNMFVRNTNKTVHTYNR